MRIPSSVKLFKSKNRDTVALDGSNKNLKKGYDTDSHATTNQSSQEESSQEESSQEISALQTHINYKLG